MEVGQSPLGNVLSLDEVTALVSGGLFVPVNDSKANHALLLLPWLGSLPALWGWFGGAWPLFIYVECNHYSLFACLTTHTATWYSIQHGTQAAVCSNFQQ